MGGYAPGTDGYDEQRDRRARHSTQRRQNVADALLGFGMLAQQMGKARRAREQQASEELFAQRFGEVMRGDADARPAGPSAPIPTPPNDPMRIDTANTAPNYVEAPSFEDRLQSDVGGGGGAMENLKNTFSFGTGPARLKPDQMMALYNAASGRRAEQRAIAREGVEDQRWEKGYQLDADKNRQASERAKVEDQRWEKGYQLDLGKDARDKAESEALIEERKANADWIRRRQPTTGSASDPNKAFLDRYKDLDSQIRSWEGAWSSADAAAERLENYAALNLDDVVLQNKMADELKNNGETSVYKTLQALLKDTTDPKKRSEDLIEKARLMRESISVQRQDPGYVARKKAWSDLGAEYANRISQMGGSQPQQAVDIDSLTPEQLIAIGNVFEADGTDPDSATPEQIADALSRSKGQ